MRFTQYQDYILFAQSFDMYRAAVLGRNVCRSLSEIRSFKFQFVTINSLRRFYSGRRIGRFYSLLSCFLHLLPPYDDLQTKNLGSAVRNVIYARLCRIWFSDFLILFVEFFLLTFDSIFLGFDLQYLTLARVHLCIFFRPRQFNYSCTYNRSVLCGAHALILAWNLAMMVDS